MNFIKLAELIGNATFLGCRLPEFHFKCNVINQKEKHPQEDRSSGGIRE
jgi:hypothetical protein